MNYQEYSKKLTIHHRIVKFFAKKAFAGFPRKPSRVLFPYLLLRFGGLETYFGMLKGEINVSPGLADERI